MKESGAKQHRLETELIEKTDIIEKITKESLEAARNEIAVEKQRVSQTNSEKDQLQGELRAAQTEVMPVLHRVLGAVILAMLVFSKSSK